MSIKSKLIRALGGYNSISDFKILSEPVCATTKSYYIDEDTIAYDKVQIARKIGEQLLDLDLIHFNVDSKMGTMGEFYTISGEVRIYDGQKV